MDSYIKCADCGLLKVHHNAKDLIGWVSMQRRISEKEIASLDFCNVDCMATFVRDAYITENSYRNHLNPEYASGLDWCSNCEKIKEKLYANLSEVPSMEIMLETIRARCREDVKASVDAKAVNNG